MQNPMLLLLRPLSELLAHPDLLLTINEGTALADLMRLSPQGSILRRLWDEKVAGREFGLVRTFAESAGREITAEAEEAVREGYAVESSAYHLSDGSIPMFPCRVDVAPNVKLFEVRGKSK